jgi:hypothetical protein
MFVEKVQNLPQSPPDDEAEIDSNMRVVLSITWLYLF